MKEILTQYAAYNTWANELLLTAILKLPEEQQQAEVKSSFPSLYKTALHMWSAASIWWQRLKLQEKVVPPAEYFSGNMQELATQLQQQDRQWQQWVENTAEHGFHHEFIYYNLKKEKFKQPVYQVLLHLFNHGTYHRGQLITMLRQLGIDGLPQTDFIAWSRKK